ncbi:hypothetical protein [Streptomyces javensis]|uniref:hypothetical protein n=1 Tax=Streptomyces javensis TaxID=114698 RepID=UPI001FE728AD|nr:hypothetical protein [Streptomyces javensis]
MPWVKSGPIFVPVVVADSASAEVNGREAPAAACAAVGVRVTSVPAARATATPIADRRLADADAVLLRCMC